MNACWCILSGTKNCIYCNNNKRTKSFLNEYINNIPYKKYYDYKPYRYNTTTITSNQAKKYENNELTKKIGLLKELNRKEKEIAEEKEELVEDILKLLETLE